MTTVISMTFVDTGDSDRKNDGKRRNRQKEIFTEISGDPMQIRQYLQYMVRCAVAERNRHNSCQLKLSSKV